LKARNSRQDAPSNGASHASSAALGAPHKLRITRKLAAQCKCGKPCAVSSVSCTRLFITSPSGSPRRSGAGVRKGTRGRGGVTASRDTPAHPGGRTSGAPCSTVNIFRKEMHRCLLCLTIFAMLCHNILRKEIHSSVLQKRKGWGWGRGGSCPPARRLGCGALGRAPRGGREGRGLGAFLAPPPPSFPPVLTGHVSSLAPY